VLFHNITPLKILNYYFNAKGAKGAINLILIIKNNVVKNLISLIFSLRLSRLLRFQFLGV
ncbi:hypothetical protein KAH27_08025, partial [bacterium]|nr:hypothetical protein [bacterium]